MLVGPTGFGGTPYPVYQGNGGFGSNGSDGLWIILLLLALGGGWGNGFGGGFGGNQLGYDFPWLMNGQQGINNNVSDGFRDVGDSGDQHSPLQRRDAKNRTIVNPYYKRRGHGRPCPLFCAFGKLHKNGAESLCSMRIAICLQNLYTIDNKTSAELLIFTGGHYDLHHLFFPGR